MFLRFDKVGSTSLGRNKVSTLLALTCVSVTEVFTEELELFTFSRGSIAEGSQRQEQQQ